MKKTALLIVISFSVISLSVAQHDHSGHEMHNGEMKGKSLQFEDKKLSEAFTHYIHLKNALVKTDFAVSSKAAVMFEKSLKQVDGSEKVYSKAVKVSNAKDIAGQRANFDALSNAFVELVKKAKKTGGEAYLEFCPMANGNTGGYWLANEKQISNPYFGEKMLRCGKVKETIK